MKWHRLKHTLIHNRIGEYAFFLQYINSGLLLKLPERIYVRFSFHSCLVIMGVIYDITSHMGDLTKPNSPLIGNGFWNWNSQATWVFTKLERYRTDHNQNFLLQQYENLFVITIWKIWLTHSNVIFQSLINKYPSQTKTNIELYPVCAGGETESMHMKEITGYCKFTICWSVCLSIRCNSQHLFYNKLCNEIFTI